MLHVSGDTMLTHALLAALLVQAPPQAAPHSKAFWQSVAMHDYALPPGGDLPALVAELEGFLASPDPDLRDEIGYSTLAAWIYQKRIVEPPLLRTLVGDLLRNLRQGIGDRESDGVFHRSFSALTLSVVVARDNAAPVLSAEDFGRIEAAALEYLAAERDLRGYDPQKGWMHSAAHTADLLKFLARSGHLAPADQTQLLDAIARKLATAPTVFTHGEDERFARAVLSIVNRADFDRAAFGAWTSRMRPARLPAKPSPADLAGAQNVKNALSKLEVLLATGPDSEPVAAARDAVRAALKDLF